MKAPAAASRQLAVDTVIAGYRIERPLGGGRMGEVYLAGGEGHRVAIRVVDARLLSSAAVRGQFERDARRACAVRHPAVCAPIDVGRLHDSVFLTMPYLEGVTVAERLAMSAERIPIERVVSIAIEITDALDASHAHGVVHGALRGSNVFELADGRIKVVDFGLAELVAKDAAASADVVPMTPEQARGRDADARGDLFALGALLYELVTGVPPFAGRSPAERAEAVAAATPPPVLKLNPRAPAPLARVITTLLQKDPRDRYRSAKDLRDDLLRLQRGEPIAPANLDAPPPLEAERPVRWRLVGGAIVLAAGLIAGAAVIWWPARMDTAPPPPVSLLVLASAADGAGAVLADSVAVQLAADLSYVPGFDVRHPPARANVALVSGGPDRLADLFDVSAVAASRLAADENRVTLSMTLTERATRRQLLTREYAGDRRDILSVIRQAAEGVRIAFRPAGPPIPPGLGPTTQSDAFLALAEGRGASDAYRRGHDEDAFKRAFDDLSRSLALDAHNAAAASSLAALYASRLEADAALDAPSRDAVDRWSRRASDLDKNDALAWSIHAVGAQTANEAFRDVVRGAAVGAKDAQRQLDLARTASLPAALAEAVARRATALDPLDPDGWLMAGRAAFALNHVDDALRDADAALDIQPDLAPALWQKLAVLVSLDLSNASRPHRAAVAELAGRLQRTDLPRVETTIAGGLAALDLAPDSDGTQAADSAMAQLTRADITRSSLARVLTFTVPLLAGRDADARALALRLLEQATAASSDLPYDWLRFDPRLRPLRADGRFGGVLDAAGVRWNESASRIQIAQRDGLWPSYLDRVFQSLRTDLDPVRAPK